jgi:ubiquinol-cytochrome c reductase iron-sulfur subunit
VSSDDQVADPESAQNRGELTPEYARNRYRSIKPEVLVIVGRCTHQGCEPEDRFQPGAQAFAADWRGGFHCPCHGSLFDLAGRVYKNRAARFNLEVPPHKFLSESRIVIGDDT